jgi:DNA replication ATP-dependent helicase Dna2
VLERRDVASADGSEAELVLAPSAQGARAAGGLSPGDRAVVSVQLDSDEPFIVSSAAVREVTPAKRVTLLLRKPLSHSAVLGRALEDLSWRVDKEASAGLAARMRGALLALVGSSGPSRLRELVIDLSEARFTDQQPLDGAWADSDLNMEQERAVQLMARAHDYALVRGLPGAGKTHTLAAGIRRVMRSGRKVLVSAHTNAAVDNVLSRLIALGEKPLRVGDQSKVSDAVKPYTLGSSGCAYASVEQLSGILSSSRCVGCTCSGAHHPALAQLTFDMCVIDEASQVLLPASLRCLSQAHSFTLCGDHAQLPPLVRFGQLNSVLLSCDNPRGKHVQVTNEDARRGGLSVSLFERLAEARPETLTPLTIQYRMNSSIMRLNNVITYDGSLSAGSREVRVPSCRMRAVDVLLRCGSRWKHQVADGCLGVEAALAERLGVSNVVKAILSKERSVVFLDQGSGGQSATATALVCEALHALKQHTSLTDSDYVCMSPYNVEVEAMQQQLRSGGLAWQAAVTVDRAQGLDKRCAVVSVGSGSGSSILSDWRRLNVALTRARHKLILVGSISGIEEESPGDSPLRSLAQFARREKLAIVV